MATDLSRKSRQRNAAGRLANAEAEIQALKPLPIAQLRALWAERHDGKRPSIRSRGMLLRMLAWEMQSEVLGRLDEKTEQKLMQIADALDSGRAYEPPIKREISAGVVLTREWRGVIHTVVITSSGVEHEGTIYRSLSDVARTITGTRWSGPRFFGLDQRQTKRQSRPIAKEIAV